MGNVRVQKIWSPAPAVLAVPKKSGDPLPSSAEPALPSPAGHDFSRVRAHPKKDLKDYPEQELRNVAVRTLNVSKEDVERAFRDPAAPRPGTRFTIDFGSSVSDEKTEREALSRVAAYLESQGILRLSSSISLEIQAAGGVYRFTSIVRTTLLKPHEVGFAPPEVVLVERIGPIAAPAQSGDPQKLLKPERTTIRKVKLQRGPDWKENEWNAVTSVLEQLPDSALQAIAGIELLRRPVGTGTEEAESNAMRRTLTFFDASFDQTAARIGGRSRLHHVVAHEIGHFVDADPLMKATKYFYNKKKWSSAVSHSGFVWGPSNGYVPEQVEGPEGVKETPFRQAAAKDGVTDRTMLNGVTSYAASSWKEQFAESYALYMNDPGLLRTLRPNIYRYFEATFPSAPSGHQNARGRTQ